MATPSAAAQAFPPQLCTALEELEIELAEGDITQKGFEKKRAKLLQKFGIDPLGYDLQSKHEQRNSQSTQQDAIVGSNTLKNESVPDLEQRLDDPGSFPDPIVGEEATLSDVTCIPLSPCHETLTVPLEPRDMSIEASPTVENRVDLPSLQRGNLDSLPMSGDPPFVTIIESSSDEFEHSAEGEQEGPISPLNLLDEYLERNPNDVNEADDLPRDVNRATSAENKEIFPHLPQSQSSVQESPSRHSRQFPGDASDIRPVSDQVQPTHVMNSLNSYIGQVDARPGNHVDEQQIAGPTSPHSENDKDIPAHEEAAQAQQQQDTPATSYRPSLAGSSSSFDRVSPSSTTRWSVRSESLGRVTPAFHGHNNVPLPYPTANLPPPNLPHQVQLLAGPSTCPRNSSPASAPYEQAMYHLRHSPYPQQNSQPSIITGHHFAPHLHPHPQSNQYQSTPTLPIQPSSLVLPAVAASHQRSRSAGELLFPQHVNAPQWSTNRSSTPQTVGLPVSLHNSSSRKSSISSQPSIERSRVPSLTSSWEGSQTDFHVDDYHPGGATWEYAGARGPDFPNMIRPPLPHSTMPPQFGPSPQFYPAPNPYSEHPSAVANGLPMVLPSQATWRNSFRIPQNVIPQEMIPHLPPQPTSPVGETFRYREIKHDAERAARYLGRQALPTRPRPFSTIGVVDIHSGTPLTSFATIAAVLRFRAQKTPKHTAFTVLDHKGRVSSTVTYEKLNARAEQLSQTIKEKANLRRGENVALLFRRTDVLEFFVGLYGCLYAGMVAVPIVTTSTHVDDELTEIIFTIDNCKIKLALTTDVVIKTLTREFHVLRGATLPRIDWWKTTDYSGTTKKKNAPDTAVTVDAAEIAYIEYTKNATGELKGVLVGHRQILAQCLQFIGGHKMTAKDVILSELEPRQQAGLLMSAFLGVLCGCDTAMVPEQAMSTPGSWLTAISKLKVTVAFATNASVLDVMSTSPSFLSSKKNQPVLSSLRTLFLKTPIPQADFQDDVEEFLKNLGSNSTTVVPLVTLDEFGGVILATREGEKQQTSDIDKNGPIAMKRVDIWIDSASLRDERVEIVGWKMGGAQGGNVDSPGTTRLTDAGAILPEASVAIVDQANSLRPPSILGEVWISAPNSMPGAFWGLPKMSQQLFRAKPTIYVQREPQIPSHLSSMTLEQAGHLTDIETLTAQNFTQTGLIGFIIDGNSVPELRIPRCFVAGLKCDRVVQTRLTKDESSEQLDGSMPISDSHFAAALIESVTSSIQGIDCCIVFAVHHHEQNLPVVLLETHRPVTDYDRMKTEIPAVLLHLHGLRVFCVGLCAPGQLPRSKPDTSKGTQLQTTFYGYNPGIVNYQPDTGVAQKIPLKNKRKYVPVDVEVCKSAFVSGDLPFLELNICTDSSVINTVKYHDRINARQKNRFRDQNVGQVTGGMMDIALLDDKTGQNMVEFPTISHVLAWRARMFPSEVALIELDHRGRETKVINFQKFGLRVQALASWLVQKKGLKPSDCAVLLFLHNHEYFYALHACLYAGILPIPLPPIDASRPMEDVPNLLQIVDDFNAKAILTSASGEDTLRSKPIAHLMRAVRKSQQTAKRGEVETKAFLPPIINTSKFPKTQKTSGMRLDDPIFHFARTCSSPARSTTYESLLASDQPDAGSEAASYEALISVVFDPDMRPTYVRHSHATLLEQCRLQAIHCSMFHSAKAAAPTAANQTQKTPSYVPLISCARGYQGFGLVYSTLMGIFAGAPMMILPIIEFYMNPQVWFDTLYKYRVKDTYTTYSMLEHAMEMMKNVHYRSFSLHNLRNLMVITESRPRHDIYTAVHQNLAANRLEDQAIATFYSSSVNSMVTTRGYMHPEVTTLWMDRREMDKGRVKVLKETRGESAKIKASAIWGRDGRAENCVVVLQDCGKVLNNTIVAIVNPITGCLCLPDEIGEIWVCSPANALGFGGSRVPEGGVGLAVADEIERKVEGLDPALSFARTGDKGFLWPVSADAADAASLSSYFETVHKANLSARGDSHTLGSTILADMSMGLHSWDRLVFAGLPHEMVLFVVGSASEEINVNGFTFFQEDLELTIENCHKAIPKGGCVVVQTALDQVTCVVEFETVAEALSVVPRIVSAVLEHHGFLLDAVSFLPVNGLARSRLGEKQRWRVSRALRAGKLPAYKTFQLRPRCSAPASSTDIDIPAGVEAYVSE
ncbi:hypothetical protein DFS34DRAFT_605239 [Phlyctochytrium arcticum]|nr:hypothetical protein DFS34DRAFT_605239 [Phlyctochytrium arcticum]